MRNKNENENKNDDDDENVRRGCGVYPVRSMRRHPSLSLSEEFLCLDFTVDLDIGIDEQGMFVPLNFLIFFYFVLGMFILFFIYLFVPLNIVIYMYTMQNKLFMKCHKTVNAVSFSGTAHSSL